MIRWLLGKLRRPPVALDPPRRPTAVCSFCGRSYTDGALVEAPNNVFICEECVALCARLFADMRARGGPESPPPPDPHVPPP